MIMIPAGTGTKLGRVISHGILELSLTSSSPGVLLRDALHDVPSSLVRD